MNKSLLQVENLSKEFPLISGLWGNRTGTVQALQNISLCVAEGETLAVVGGSGSGKTTLAKILCRLLLPDQGTLLWDSRPSTAFNRKEWAQRVQMVFQDPYASLNPKLSVGMQLAEALKVAGQANLRAEDLLEQVRLPRDAVGRYPFQFSGGQRQRIAIARALALEPRLLILDEPLSALDITTQAEILALFQQVRKAKNLSYLLITHDLGLAAQIADYVMVFQEGQLVEEGPARSVLSSPQHAYTRALVEAVI